VPISGLQTVIATSLPALGSGAYGYFL